VATHNTVYFLTTAREILLDLLMMSLPMMPLANASFVPARSAWDGTGLGKATGDSGFRQSQLSVIIEPIPKKIFLTRG